jgi:hypothetical protein
MTLGVNTSLSISSTADGDSATQGGSNNGGGPSGGSGPTGGPSNGQPGVVVGTTASSAANVTSTNAQTGGAGHVTYPLVAIFGMILAGMMM